MIGAELTAKQKGFLTEQICKFNSMGGEGYVCGLVASSGDKYIGYEADVSIGLNTKY